MDILKDTPYYRLSVDEVLVQLRTKASGLTNKEAAKRLQQFGRNQLITEQPSSVLRTLAERASNQLVATLMAAGIIAWLLDNKQVSILLLGIVLVTTAIHYWRKRQALGPVDHSSTALVTLTSVLRSGKLQRINTAELVPGDVVYLEKDSVVPADIRVVGEEALRTDDGAITGVHKSSKKFSQAIKTSSVLSKRHNYVYMGTTVTGGTAYGVVITTGQQTELGIIASRAQAGPQSLQLLLQLLTSNAIKAAIPLALLATIAALWGDYDSTTAFLIGLATLVATLPIGLSAESELIKTSRKDMTLPSLELAYHNLKIIAHQAITVSAAKLSVLVIGLLLLLTSRFPLALPTVQIIAIDVVLFLPMIALGWDRPAANVLHKKAAAGSEHIISRNALAHLAAFGILSGLLSYGTYLLYFVRRNLSPVSIEAVNPIYLQAATVAYLTLALCLYVSLFFERADNHEKLTLDYLISNKKLLTSLAIALAIIILIIYLPACNSFFATQPLSAADWLTAIAAAGLYAGLRLSHRHTRKHSRKAVLQLHRDIYGIK
ncbi:MAG: ATPase, P-type (transporting), superfamily, subfamily [Candidatus Saccharibacteria bacterium]|nr:ATPase, P-type (transporting), superfamily, subfamily [Candidatus Saccharibacteria bacterium]